jgi:hypothetical protein
VNFEPSVEGRALCYGEMRVWLGCKRAFPGGRPHAEVQVLGEAQFIGHCKMKAPLELCLEKREGQVGTAQILKLQTMKGDLCRHPFCQGPAGACGVGAGRQSSGVWMVGTV